MRGVSSVYIGCNQSTDVLRLGEEFLINENESKISSKKISKDTKNKFKLSNISYFGLRRKSV